MSTWSGDGHFPASYSHSQRQRGVGGASAAAEYCREAANRRGNVRSGYVSSTGARAHGINANQVFGWRQLYLAGRLGEPKPGLKLLPVRVSGSESAPVVVEHRPADVRTASPNTIHIELRQAQVRIEGNADPALVRVLLECLRG